VGIFLLTSSDNIVSGASNEEHSEARKDDAEGAEQVDF
jgi:hypothetical protein